MDESACPRCKTTKYRNPALKLLVNVCGHSLCESCVEVLFVRGSASCAQCGVALRRSNFRVQQFEDVAVEKEIDIRRRILKDFNKREEDFETLREYNDYLEMVETIIFNLANGSDVEETKQQVEQYKKENKDLIRKNRSKLSQDAEYIQTLLVEEEEAAKLSKQIMQEEEQNTLQTKRKQDALIDELASSDLPAEHILSTYQQEAEASKPKQPRFTAFSSGESIQANKAPDRGFLPVPKATEGEMYVYVEESVNIYGPPLHKADEHLAKYVRNIRPATDSQLSGGYKSEYCYHRSVNEALCGLFFDFEVVQMALGDAR